VRFIRWFDVKYGLASNLIALGTVNTTSRLRRGPATIQSHSISIAFRKAPVLPRKFRRLRIPLWNQDFSSSPGKLHRPNFRTGSPIDAGGKIAGHVAGFDLGVMDVRTRAVGPIPMRTIPFSRKAPLTPGSYIGFIATDKESGNALDPTTAPAASTPNLFSSTISIFAATTPKLEPA